MNIILEINIDFDIFLYKNPHSHSFVLYQNKEEVNIVGTLNYSNWITFSRP